MASTIKPGPQNRDWALIPTAAGNGGGIPCQITAISNPGTSGAIATVVQLDVSGLLTSTFYSNVFIIPYPEFAELGDKGMMTRYTPTSGLGFTDVQYIQISKSAFLVF